MPRSWKLSMEDYKKHQVQWTPFKNWRSPSRVTATQPYKRVVQPQKLRFLLNIKYVSLRFRTNLQVSHYSYKVNKQRKKVSPKRWDRKTRLLSCLPASWSPIKDFLSYLWKRKAFKILYTMWPKIWQETASARFSCISFYKIQPHHFTRVRR